MIKAPPPISFDAMPEGWLDLVRTVIVRDGHATRGRGDIPIIEVKSLTTNRWQPLGLPGGSTHFASFEDRNKALDKITGGAR